MNMFQYFLSHESQPSHLSRRHLGQKNYLLNHYLSMFFRLIVEMDFCALEVEIYQSISDLQKKIQDDLENNNGSILMFDCQEPSTEMELCWTALADTLLEQALTDFQNETVSTYQGTVDLVDLEQTEEKLVELLGKDVWEQFQQALIQCFLPCSLLQLFWQGFIIEITKRFLSRDLETDQEVFRLFITHFIHNKSD